MVRNPVTKYTNQKAVYWQFDGADGFGGAKFKAPEEISCRWTDATQIVATSAGKEIVSRANLLLLEPLVEQSVVWLGRLADLTVAQKEDPWKVDGVEEVVRMDSIPSRKADFFVQKAFLGRKER